MLLTTVYNTQLIPRDVCMTSRHRGSSKLLMMQRKRRDQSPPWSHYCKRRRTRCATGTLFSRLRRAREAYRGIVSVRSQPSVFSLASSSSRM
jgi:hypothetical protein